MTFAWGKSAGTALYGDGQNAYSAATGSSAQNLNSHAIQDKGFDDGVRPGQK